MRILHTADLHIGKTLCECILLDDQREMLEQMIRILEEERVDVLIIAGDIYDRAVPSGEAVSRFNRFISDVVNRLNVTVLAVAGNHDSPDRLEFVSEVLSHRGLYIKGVLPKDIRPVTLTDAYGAVDFWLMPFAHPAHIRLLFPEWVEEGVPLSTFDQAAGRYMEEILARCNPERRNILVTHYFMTDGASAEDIKVMPQRCDSEQTMTIGGVDNVNSARLDRFDYVALGHLHRAQASRREAVRYSGSPLKYSFSEEKHDKTVTLIDLSEKGNLKITQRPIVPVRDMVTIEGSLADMLSADSPLRRHSGDYVQAILTDPPGISEPMARLRSVYKHTLKVLFREQDFDRADDAPTLERLQTMSPEAFFEEYYKAMRGRSMNGEERRVLHTVIQKAEGGARRATDLTDNVGL